MACNNQQTIFWEGLTFGSASQIFTDSALTSVAPDGFYSFGGTVRQMLNGNLLAPQSCTPCNIPCGNPKNNTITGGGLGRGTYQFNVDVGTNTGAVIIKMNPQVNPSRLIWSYDGLTSSEYSSSTWGYAQGIIGEYDLPITNGGSVTCDGNTVSNNNGSNSQIISGLSFSFDFSTQSFVSATIPVQVNLGPYNPSDVNLVPGIPNEYTMVIPKPNATPSIVSITIETICDSSNWIVGTNCPQPLLSSPLGVTRCALYTTTVYSASSFTDSGYSSLIQINDFVFTDVNGVNPLAAGVYYVFTSGIDQIMTVSSDGVVTNLVACTP